MDLKEVRVGNLVDLYGEVATIQRSDFSEKEHGIAISSGKPIRLTKEWLVRLGFLKKENKTYINGFQYLKQVTGNHEDISIEGVDRDGVWMDGIGSYDWEKTKGIGVNTLCRGNYCANAVRYVHELQNLFFALSGKEIEVK